MHFSGVDAALLTFREVFGEDDSNGVFVAVMLLLVKGVLRNCGRTCC